MTFLKPSSVFGRGACGMAPFSSLVAGVPNYRKILKTCVSLGGDIGSAVEFAESEMAFEPTEGELNDGASLPYLQIESSAGC